MLTDVTMVFKNILNVDNLIGKLKVIFININMVVKHEQYLRSLCHIKHFLKENVKKDLRTNAKKKKHNGK